MGYSVTGVDNVSDCLATCYAAGHRTKKWDLTEPYLPSQGFDMVWASPPCTAFSVAGKRNALKVSGELMQAVVQENWDWGRANRIDPDVWLILSAMQTILHVQPAVVGMENVQQTRGVMEACLRVLKRYGYDGQVDLLSAEQFGVAQTRNRCFLVAALDGQARLPSPSHREFVNPRHNLKHVEVGERDQDLLPWVSMAEALGFEDWTLSTGRDWKEGGGRSEAQTMPSSVPSPVVSAQSGRQWMWLKTGMSDTARHVGEPAPTVNFGHSAASWKLDSERLRVDQAALLQGFLPGHPWDGSKTSKFRKIGNAVPPPVAIAVAGAAASLDWQTVLTKYLEALYPLRRAELRDRRPG